jgi:toxin ParE1/3/4
MAKLRFRPRAKQDLQRIYLFIADFAGPTSARAIVTAIEARCRTLLDYPHRGTPNPDLRPGLRTVPVGKAVVAYRVESRDVIIVRVRYGGQQLTPEEVAD